MNARSSALPGSVRPIRSVLSLPVLLLILCPIWVLSEEGQTPSPAVPEPGSKIAFYRLSQVLEGTEESKIEISSITAFVNDMQREKDSRTAELEQLKQQNAQESTIILREESLKLFQDSVQRDIVRKRDDFIGRVSGRLAQILGEYGEQRGLDAIVVLDQGFPTYVKPSLDITQDLIRFYNERFPVGAPPSVP